MKIVVIGLGSMGKRRIRLIHELYPAYIIYGVDGREDRRIEAKKLYGIECYQSISHMDKTIDCAFICTSPLSHSAIISECLKRKWHVFTELNLVPDGYEDNIKFAAESGLQLFLSSTFFYREEIRYIRSRINLEEKWNYIYHVGQYLPDWHPWENYEDFFVGNKRTNGCRELLAIELPWLIGTFGEVEKIHVLSDKMTKLNIEYNDNFIIQMVHENKCKGLLMVDIVSPCAVRKFEAYTDGRYIVWNGTPDSLAEFDSNTKLLTQVSQMEETEHMKGYAAFVVENAYKNEIQEFFEVVEHGKEPIYGFKQDRKILNLIDWIGA